MAVPIHPLLAPGSGMGRTIPLRPYSACWQVTGQLIKKSKQCDAGLLLK